MSGKSKQNNMTIEIINYKSIKNLKLKLSNIQYYIGKNEAGKSNILAALQEINNNKLDSKNTNFNSDLKIGTTTIKYDFYLIKTLQDQWNKLLKLNGSLKITKTINTTTNFYAFDIIAHPNINKALIKLLNSYSNNKFESFVKKLNPKFNPKTLNLSLVKEILNKIKSASLNNNSPKQQPKKVSAISKDNVTKINHLINLINKTALARTVIKCYDSKVSVLEDSYTFEAAKKSPIFKIFWKALNRQESDIQKLISLKGHEQHDHKKSLKEAIEKSLQNLLKQFEINKVIDLEIIINDNDFVIRAADVFENNRIGKHRGLSIHGNGIRHYLSLILFFSSINANDKIVLVDAPGSFLDQDMIANLVKRIASTAKKYPHNYFLVATTNMSFVNATNVANVVNVVKTLKSGTNFNTKKLSVVAPKNLPVVTPKKTPKISKLMNFSKKNGKVDPIEYATELWSNDKVYLSMLSEKTIVFVEGYQDWLFFNAFAKKYKFNDLFFISLQSANKDHPMIYFAMSIKKKPYFIYDYDRGGNDGKQGIIKKFPTLDNRCFFPNNQTDWKATNPNFATENIFGQTKFKNKIIAKSKNTPFYEAVARAIINGNLKITPAIEKQIKTLFNKLKKDN